MQILYLYLFSIYITSKVLYGSKFGFLFFPRLISALMSSLTVGKKFTVTATCMRKLCRGLEPAIRGHRIPEKNGGPLARDFLLSFIRVVWRGPAYVTPICNIPIIRPKHRCRPINRCCCRLPSRRKRRVSRRGQFVVRIRVIRICSQIATRNNAGLVSPPTRRDVGNNSIQWNGNNQSRVSSLGGGSQGGGGGGEGESEICRDMEDLYFHLEATERYWLFQSVDIVGAA